MIPHHTSGGKADRDKPPPPLPTTGPLAVGLFGRPRRHPPTWRYSHKAGWHEGHHPLPEPADDNASLTDWLGSAGFELQDEYETADGFLGIVVYEREDCGDWFVGVDLPCYTRLVYCPDMPSALKLLAEVMPVVEMAQRLGAMTAAREKRIEARRRGGIYNAAKRCMEVPQ